MLDFTTATPEQRKQAYDAIAAELGDDRFFTTKELDALPKILAPEEQVLSFSSGLMDGNTWLIVLTDRRVMFVDKGLVFGLKHTSMDLEAIVTIEGETGLMFGSMRIHTAAGPREIRNVWKRTVNPFLNKVNEAIRARREGRRLVSPGTDGRSAPSAPAPQPAPSPPPSPTHAPPPPVDIRPAPGATAAPVPSQSSARARLDRLLAAGAISEREYADEASRLR